MFRTSRLSRKLLLVVMIAALGTLALPTATASAAGVADAETPPTGESVPNARLALAWARAQRTYHGQGERLDKAGDLIARIQALIDKAEEKGWDASAVQAALDAFAEALPAARSAHQPGAAIITRHAGFDGQGRVIDRPTAAETVKALRQVIADTRAAMDGTGRALLRALKDFRAAHPPAEAPAP